MKDNQASKFQTGDTVILKTNGKRLTVRRRSYEYNHEYGIKLQGKSAAGKKMVGCSWEENGVMKEDFFPEEDLELFKK